MRSVPQLSTELNRRLFSQENRVLIHNSKWYPLLARTLLCRRRALDGLLVTLLKYGVRRQAATEQEKGCFLNKRDRLIGIQLDKTNAKTRFKCIFGRVFAYPCKTYFVC